VSQDQSKEVTEINQLLAQAKSSIYATCGTANGLISDTINGILIQLGQRLVVSQTQVNRLIKENEELKKKNDNSDKKK